MYKGGNAQDKERVDSLKRYTVKADGGNESTVHAGTRGDKTNFANFALRFLTAVPGSEAWDSITRTDMANFATLVMGLYPSRAVRARHNRRSATVASPSTPMVTIGSRARRGWPSEQRQKLLMIECC